jgi:polyhydroxybutyrate depolymerase
VRIFKSVPIALACLFAAHMSFAATSDAVDFLVHDGYKHRYIVHVSSAYDPEIPVPLVLNFHDVFGKAETQRKLSGMNATADKYGFIVVYPEGIKGTWNAGQCCGFAEWQNLDDVGFVRELIETLQRKYSIDKQRIYATGFGDGAMLCYRLACELPDRFAAIGPVGGGMGGDGPLPSRPVAILHIHGVKDQNYPFNGGVGKRSVATVSFRSVAESLNFWLKANHCQLTPVVTKDKDFVIERYERSPGQSGAPVVLCRLLQIGHLWPALELFNTNELLWAFFSQQKL